MTGGVRPSARAVAGLQAAYFVGTGLWPLVHHRSFERIAGRKRELWLVRTVGGLAAAIGVALGVAAIRGSRSKESVALALGSAIVFGVADLHAARTQSKAYLGDTILQLAFAPAWIRPWRS